VLDSTLCFMDARALARLVRTHVVSAREVMAAHLAQIERHNPSLNAIVALRDPAECLALAETADRALARGEAVGPLHGLPIAFKDLEAAVGFPCTRGSVIFKDDRPAADTVMVERLRRAGAIPIGKTNVPEFGMGSHTYNRVYGTTVNPYDRTKSAGGSSGGAGAAIAAGMLPLADGSDLGGSLRNPANFNNVVALRPTVGLVPMAPSVQPIAGLAVKGPMARSVSDVAWLLSMMAGADTRDPSCYPSAPLSFAEPLASRPQEVRIAWSPDLGGLPMDPGVRAVIEQQRQIFEDLGCIVEEACPEFEDVDDIFLTLRAWTNWQIYGPLLVQHREEIKPEAIWDIEAGAALTGADVAHAMLRHRELHERMRRFEERFAFFVCAVNQVPPFDAELAWPRAINGVAMEHYLAWMRSTYWISTTGRPAVSVPAGFTPQGLPVGMQIVGRWRQDEGLLRMAYAFEQATGIGQKRPPEPL